MEKWNQTRQPGGVGRLILRFEDWSVSAAHDALGYQLDNETRELTLLGDLPQGWTWDVLVQAQGKTDIWPLALTDEGAKFTLTDENLSIKGPYCLQVRGTKGSQVRHCNAVTVYVLRTLAGTVTWPTLPTEFAQAEKNIKELNAHPPIPGENGVWLLWDLETSAYIESQLSVPVGPAGPANTLEIGTVETLEPGQTATAQIIGEAPNQTLSLGIPRGQPGQTGATPALEIGQVETLEPDQPATAEFSGTPEKPVLSLGIPQGQPGKDGPANTLSIGQVETLEPGEPATAEISGEAPNQTLSLGIPQGQTGKTGATPALEIGQVETLEPDQPATAEFSGTPEKPVLSLGIPQGQPGKDGVQLNDDAINTTEAWSSKKIVDTLCPAFSVSGNPVTCNPVEDYPLSAVVTLEPKQAGTGDPSPENVRPISGWDEVTVNVRGKNLLAYPGEVVIPQNIYALPIKDSELGSAIKQLPRDIQLVMTANWSYYTESSTYKTIILCEEGLTNSIKFKDGKPVTIPKNYNIDTIFMYCGDNKTQDCIVSNIQFEAGSTPTPYEPYQGDTYDIALPEMVYGGSVDAVTGQGEKAWGYLELNGEEESPTEVVYEEVSFIDTPCIRIGIVPLSSLTIAGRNSICSHANYVSGFPRLSNADNKPRVWIYFPVSDYPDESAVRNYLAAQASAGTPVQLAYKLATPESFQATGNQALPAVAGLNTLYTDGDSLTVTGRRDLVSALEDLQTTMTAVTTLISEGGLT